MTTEHETAWAEVEALIGHRFADRSLLVQALTHSSFANENPDPTVGDNQRLEFLGDAVLGLVIGRRLFVRDPEAAEGELSRVRAELVSAPSLARLAGDLRLGSHLRLGRGEARSGGHAKDSLLADALEALFGAVFLDAGYAAADAVISRLFAPLLTAAAAPAGQDYKTRLQEFLQADRQMRPGYRLVASRGPDHRRSYEVEVCLGASVLGRGTGPTKKRAEQEAARQALAALAAEGGDR